MKSLHLYIALLFAIFAFQAQSLKLTKSQASLGAGAQFSSQGSSRFGFKDLLQAAYESTDSTQALANVFRYYIEGTTYFNYIQSLFCQANTAGGEFITLDEYYGITDGQGIHRSDAHRVFQYVRGVFGTPETEDGETPIDSFSFNQAVDVLFSESLSFITFSYITGSSQHTRHVTVSREEILEALVKIFNLFKDIYPLPDCDELGYLFQQCDEDKDGRLNLQEFHTFLSIYIRYYKYGIQNNRYAAVIMKDKVFNHVFDNAEGLGGKTDRAEFLWLAFKRFLQITISDKSLNQMSHLLFTKFDFDGSGAIDPKEFAALLGFFYAPIDEVDVLFVAADTDGSGQIDFSEFVVTLTTLLRKLVADFAYNLLETLGGTANLENTYWLFQVVEYEEGEKLIPADKFREIWESVDKYGDSDLDEELYAVVISEIIAFIRTKSRIEEEAEISAIAGIDVDDTSAQEIIAIKEDASQQVDDIIYGLEEGLGIEEEPEYFEIPFEEKPIIDEIEEETGYTIDEINEIVEDQFGPATIEDVIETVAQTATEEIIDAVTAVAIEEIGHTDCPTHEAIEEAIEVAIESGIIDAVVQEVEDLTPEELAETVVEIVEEAEVIEDAAVAIDLGGDVDTSEIKDAVEENTGVELTTEDIVEIIGDVSGAETVEDIVDIIENSTTEEIIDVVTEVIQETPELPEGVTEAQYEIAVIEEIQDQTGLPIDEIEAAVEDQTGGASLEEVIEAATGVATEELVDTIVEAVIEEAEGTECPTVEAIEETIEDVIESGVVEDIIEEIEETSPEDLIESIEDNLPGVIGNHDDDIVEETIEETGYTGEEIDEIIESEIGGGATIEDVIDAAEEIATEEVIEAVTEAVIEEVESTGCPTEQAIEDAIEEVIEGGAIDDIVEELQEASDEDVIETVTEVLESDHEDIIEEYHEPEIVDDIIEETGYTGEEIDEIIESEIGGGATIEDVIDAAEEIASEEVIEAVTEAVIEEVESTGCPTEQAIEDAIEEVIEGGAVDEIIEDLESADSDEIIEAVVEHHEEAVEEHNDEVVEEIAQETGYTGEEIVEIIEAETGGASIEDVIEAAEELATEEVIDAVAEAVLEEASHTDCPTEEGIHDAIHAVIEGGAVDEVIAAIEHSSPEETIDVITEAIEEEGSEDIIEESSYLQLNSNKARLRKNFLRRQ